MGIQITPIFNINRSNFEVDNLTVNDDASISGDLDGNTATFNSITSTDLTLLNPLSIPSLTLTGKSGILQEIECTGSETIYYKFIAPNTVTHPYNVTILPILPSTYYTGSIKASADNTGGGIMLINVDGSVSLKTLSSANLWFNIPLPRGTIGVNGVGNLAPATTLKVGFTNTYLPLPPL